MPPLELKSHVGKDHRLTLDLPVEYSDVNVCIVIKPDTSIAGKNNPRDANGWPAGFFERTEGKFQGDLERAPQGEYETREEF